MGKAKVTAMILALPTLLIGCDKSGSSFSLLSTSQSFQQSTSYVQRKVDILWVIDNSGSMETSQTNLGVNFNSFINRFSQLGLDFRMGVISSDAYMAYHYGNNNMSALRAGSGVRIIDSSTPDMAQTFMANITLGIDGSGDERAFSSIEHALDNPLNGDFLRPDAFLAVIIVSDEDDFSHYDWQSGLSSYFFSEDYYDPSMFSISHFTDLLDEKTNSEAGDIRNYSVSTISILDQDCLDALANEFPGRKIGYRYAQLVDATGGTRGSLCGDFGNTLEAISNRVIELSSVFRLGSEPVPETISITVNGQLIPQSATDGWTYDPTTWSISFHGNSIPPAGANVQIYFDPKSVKI